jgi:ribosomal protein S21
MKNKSSKLGIMKTYRERQRYEKPSEIKVRKSKEGKINLYKAKIKRERNL